MSEPWGPGKKAEKAEGFELGHLDDGTPYELIFGEHPHSRRDNSIYARFADKMGADNERVVGFAGHRILVDIELRTMNYLKTSGMSGDEVRKGGEWRIRLNGQEVYSDFTRDPLEALLTIRRKLSLLLDLPVQLWKESPVGRRIYYRDIPAVITDWIPDQGCVIIEPVGVEVFPKPPWRSGEQELERHVKDDILTPHIWWFRDEEAN